MNTLKTKNMNNPYQLLWEQSEKRNQLYAEGFGTAKGYFKAIQEYPENAKRWAEEAIYELEKLSIEIYKPKEDAKV